MDEDELLREAEAEAEAEALGGDELLRALGGASCAQHAVVGLEMEEAADAVEAGPELSVLERGEMAAAMREVWSGMDLVEAVHFLTFFLAGPDLRPRDDGVWRPADPPGVCERAEAEYFRVAGDRLRRTLGAARVAVAGVGGGGTALMYRGRALDGAGVAGLRNDLLRPLGAAAAFDFENAAALALRSCAAVLARHAAGDVPGLAEGLAEVRVAANAVSGEPFMVPFEACFQTDMANRTVSVPIPGALTAAHRDLMMERHHSGSLAELHADFFVVCLVAPCHEALHAVQHLAGQRDPDARSWSAEHDASYACLSLFWEAAAEPPLAAVLPPGARELVLARELRQAAARAARLAPAERASYLAWRRSFGADAPPPAAAAGAQPTLEGDFKSVLAAEAFSRAHLAEQLAALFRDRAGNVAAARPRLAAALESGPDGLPADSPGVLVRPP